MHFTVQMQIPTAKNANRARGTGTPCNGPYKEAPAERGTFFRLKLYKRVGILDVEVYERVGKSVVKIFYRALVKILRTGNGMVYGCFISFNRHYMKRTRRLIFRRFIHNTG